MGGTDCDTTDLRSFHIDYLRYATHNEGLHGK